MSELVGNFLRHRALRHFSKHWEPTCKRCVASPKFSEKFSTRSSSFEALEIFSNEFLTSLLLVHFFFSSYHTLRGCRALVWPFCDVQLFSDDLRFTLVHVFPRSPKLSSNPRLLVFLYAKKKKKEMSLSLL